MDSEWPCLGCHQGPLQDQEAAAPLAGDRGELPHVEGRMWQARFHAVERLAGCRDCWPLRSDQSCPVHEVVVVADGLPDGHPMMMIGLPQVLGKVSTRWGLCCQSGRDRQAA